MLRLVSGKYCEQCKESKVNAVSEHFGVFYCSCCIERFTKGAMSLIPGWNYGLTKVIINSPVCQWGPMKRIWTEPVKDAAGENYGPLVTKHDIECSDESFYVAQADLHFPKLCNIFVLPYENLHKHRLCSTRVDAIGKTYEGYIAKAEKREKERKEQIYIKKRQATEKTYKNGKARIISMIKSLSEIVGDVPWSDVLMDYDFIRKSPMIVEARFKCNIVEDILRPISVAPIKKEISRERLKEAAHTLKKRFGIIWSNNFHNFTFLSDTDPLEASLYTYFQEQSIDDLLKSNCLNSRTLELIEKGNLLRALESLDYSRFRDALALGIASSTIISKKIKTEQHSQAQKLAAGLWNAEFNNHNYNETRYRECVEKFPYLYQNVIEFLESEETCTWRRRFDGKWASYIENVWKGERRIILSLLKRDFRGILDKFDTDWNYFCR